MHQATQDFWTVFCDRMIRVGLTGSIWWVWKCVGMFSIWEANKEFEREQHDD